MQRAYSLSTHRSAFCGPGQWFFPLPRGMVEPCQKLFLIFPFATHSYPEFLSAHLGAEFAHGAYFWDWFDPSRHYRRKISPSDESRVEIFSPRGHTKTSCHFPQFSSLAPCPIKTTRSVPSRTKMQTSIPTRARQSATLRKVRSAIHFFALMGEARVQIFNVPRLTDDPGVRPRSDSLPCLRGGVR